MRALYLAPLAFALLSAFAEAAEAPRDIKGLYLMTDYPAVTVRPGTTSTVPLRLQNYGLAPERYQLSVAGRAHAWTPPCSVGGQPVVQPCAPDQVSAAASARGPGRCSPERPDPDGESRGAGTQVSLPLAVSSAPKDFRQTRRGIEVAIVGAAVRSRISNTS